MPRVLIVDDYAPIRNVIRTFLEFRSTLEICGEAVDGADAIQKAEQLKPDLIISGFSYAADERRGGCVRSEA